MGTWLEKKKSKNYIKTYSTQNEGKSVVAERFIRTLKQDLQICDFSTKKCVY